MKNEALELNKLRGKPGCPTLPGLPTERSGNSKALIKMILAAKTLASAVRLARVHLTYEEGEPGPATLALIQWGRLRMRLKELRAMPRTTFDRIEHNFARERGRVICTRSHITDAQAVKARFGHYWQGSIFRGTDFTRSAAYTALRSPPKLHKGETVVFCGVVTSASCTTGCRGLTAHSVRLVGLFVPATRGPGADVRTKIRTGVRARRGDIHKCLFALFAKQPDVYQGSIKIAFSIHPSGRVKMTRVAETTLCSKSTVECIRSAVSRWSFPRLKRQTQDDITVQYPFRFGGKGGCVRYPPLCPQKAEPCSKQPWPSDPARVRS